MPGSLGMADATLSLSLPQRAGGCPMSSVNSHLTPCIIARTIVQWSAQIEPLNDCHVRSEGAAIMCFHVSPRRVDNSTGRCRRVLQSRQRHQIGLQVCIDKSFVYKANQDYDGKPSRNVFYLKLVGMTLFPIRAIIDEKVRGGE